MRFSTRTRLALLLLAGIIVGLHYLGALAPLENLVVRTLQPAQGMLVRWIPFRSAKTDAQKDPQRLRSLELELSRALVDNAHLREEVRRLQAQIDQQGYLEQEQYGGVPATVVGRSVEGDTQILIIDRGTERGLQSGQPVITGDGIFVGVIERAERGRSTVTLVTAAQTRIGAEVQNASRSQGIISGEHGLTMRLRFVPQNEKLEKGLTIVTSAIDEKIPTNLLIGTITEVHFTTGDLFQEATVQPLTDLQAVRYVSVLGPS